MNILAIETSCDETAVSIIEGEGEVSKNLSPISRYPSRDVPISRRKTSRSTKCNGVTLSTRRCFGARNGSMPAGGRLGTGSPAHFRILSNTVLSQASIHAHYGGVFPAVAKREHAENLIPVLKRSLEEAGLYAEKPAETLSGNIINELEKIFERERELLKQFLTFIPSLKKPDVDTIAVTRGPGLAPTLWVGVNFARALALVWNMPIVPVNHMEGHILSALMKEKEFSMMNITFPILALLISGGHTELILMRDWGVYEKLGETRDDAAGEAFDKVARILGLPYPGGPEISKIARDGKENEQYHLPRPMIHSDDFDFSFSGLKTAVLYMVKKIPELVDQIKADIAKEFQQAVTDVLLKKTMRAVDEYGVSALVLGGGVSANTHIREAFKDAVANNADVTLLLPPREFSTDNAAMIGIAGYVGAQSGKATKNLNITAEGNLSL